MVSQSVIVLNKTGIHARPASLFVNTASGFKADIKVFKNGKSAIAKSLLGILALGISQGSEITISAEGEDEQAAVTSLVKLVESKFGEES